MLKILDKLNKTFCRRQPADYKSTCEDKSVTCSSGLYSRIVLEVMSDKVVMKRTYYDYCNGVLFFTNIMMQCSKNYKLYFKMTDYSVEDILKLSRASLTNNVINCRKSQSQQKYKITPRTQTILETKRDSDQEHDYYCDAEIRLSF